MITRKLLLLGVVLSASCADTTSQGIPEDPLSASGFGASNQALSTGTAVWRGSGASRTLAIRLDGSSTCPQSAAPQLDTLLVSVGAPEARLTVGDGTIGTADSDISVNVYMLSSGSPSPTNNVHSFGSGDVVIEAVSETSVTARLRAADDGFSVAGRFDATICPP